MKSIVILFIAAFFSFLVRMNDGVLDVIASERNFMIYGRVYFQKNTGTKEKPNFEPFDAKPFGLNKRSTSAPTVADLNNDGFLEVFTTPINYKRLNQKYNLDLYEYEDSKINMYTQKPLMQKIE